MMFIVTSRSFKCELPDVNIANTKQITSIRKRMQVIKPLQRMNTIIYELGKKSYMFIQTKQAISERIFKQFTRILEILNFIIIHLK